jgi:hypothetical protein
VILRTFGYRPHIARNAGALLLVASVFTPCVANDVTTARAWRTFVRQNQIGRCFPGLVPTFENRTLSGVAALAVTPKPIKLEPAAYERLGFGAGFEKPLATEIQTNDSAWQGSKLTAERNSDVVTFLLESPGGTTRGFIVASGRAPVLSRLLGPDVGRLRRTFAPALVPPGSAVRRCGMSLAAFYEAGEENETSLIVVLRDGVVIGATEIEEG